MTLALVAPPTSPAETALSQLYELRQTLAETVDVPEAMAAVDRADAIRAWVRVARLRGEVAFQAGELSVRAQRRVGELLFEVTARDGKPRRNARSVLPRRSLEQLGLSGKQSSRWQLVARLPADEFEQRLEACRQAERPPAVEAFVRAAARFALPMRKRATPTSTLLHRAVLAMREVRSLTTPKEVTLAREIGRMSAGWVAQLDEHDRAQRETAAVARNTSCLLCGRTAPHPLPPRCQICGGAWFTA